MAESQSADDAQIETGVEEANDQHDWIGFADDGEHAVRYRVTREDDTTVAWDVQYCEGGLREKMGRGVHRDDIRTDKPTREFARELAQADPQLAIEQARKHFQSE